MPLRAYKPSLHILLKLFPQYTQYAHEIGSGSFNKIISMP